MGNKEKFIAICKEQIRRDGLDKLLEWCESTDIFQRQHRQNIIAITRAAYAKEFTKR